MNEDNVHWFALVKHDGVLWAEEQSPGRSATEASGSGHGEDSPGAALLEMHQRAEANANLSLGAFLAPS